jgi:hypothetical protein
MTSPPPLSEVLMDFGRPALRSAPEGASLRTYHLLMTLVVRVWNETIAEAASTPGRGLEAVKADLAKVDAAGRDAFLQLAEALHERKRAHFHDDARFVGAWELTANKAGFVFRCV